VCGFLYCCHPLTLRPPSSWKNTTPCLPIWPVYRALKTSSIFLGSIFSHCFFALESRLQWLGKGAATGGCASEKGGVDFGPRQKLVFDRPLSSYVPQLSSLLGCWLFSCLVVLLQLHPPAHRKSHSLFPMHWKKNQGTGISNQLNKYISSYVINMSSLQ